MTYFLFLFSCSSIGEELNNSLRTVGPELLRYLASRPDAPNNKTVGFELEPRDIATRKQNKKKSKCNFSQGMATGNYMLSCIVSELLFTVIFTRANRAFVPVSCPHQM